MEKASLQVIVMAEMGTLGATEERVRHCLGTHCGMSDVGFSVYAFVSFCVCRSLSSISVAAP